MIRTILIGVDDSDGSNKALVAGAEIATQFDAKVVVVHASSAAKTVLDTPSPGSRELLSELEERGRLVLERARGLLWKHGVGRPELLFLPEKPVPAVLAAAEERQADLIVVGSRGLGSVSSVLMGSVSQRLVERAECPVLVVR